MIVEVELLDRLAASVNVDTGYPKVCNFSDPVFARMVKLIAFVEESDIPVVPNNAFFMMKHLIARGSFNARGGHAFRFWFMSEADAAKFHGQFAGTLEIPPVLPKIS